MALIFFLLIFRSSFGIEDINLCNTLQFSPLVICFVILIIVVWIVGKGYFFSSQIYLFSSLWFMSFPFAFMLMWVLPAPRLNKNTHKFYSKTFMVSFILF